MPFGLKTAPITFQRMITQLLDDLKGRNVFAYLDDIIIASPDVDSHLATLEAVLERLRQAGLKVKLSKCEFLKKTMADKVQAVSKFPLPSTVDQVRSFLGLAGYYRPFMKGFSQIAAPLTQLLKKDSTFHWDAPQQKSFESLKLALVSAPVLQFPDYSKPFTVFTDASQTWPHRVRQPPT